MYRLGLLVVIILAVAIGLIVGTLNHQVLTIDLLWTELTWPSGLILLSAMVIGILIGVLLVFLFSVLPLRMKLRRARNSRDADDGYSNPRVSDSRS